MTLTTIEKAAKLMGLKYHRVFEEGLETEFSYEDYVGDNSSRREWFDLFNPYTNKADLMDVECALGIDIRFEAKGDIKEDVHVYYEGSEGVFMEDVRVKDGDRFTARAHAVMAVVEQIYDRREG
jgi:hypothetical protein